MKDRKPDEPLSLMGELRRRKVLYTAVVYGVSAFAITEITAFVFENFGAPEWAERLLAALFVAGFPVAMFLSWAFDVGADGIVRATAGKRRNRRSTIALALGLLLVATGGLFYLIFPKPQAPAVAVAPVTGPHAGYGFEPREKLDNSIAVLPFESLSTDPDDAIFSSGVAEEVLNHLGTYGELNIIARTSSFVFEGSDFPAPRISALLGVRYLLQGSVRRHQDQVRISTQLVDEHGVQLWSKNFDRRLTDIFAIQTEIAAAVAEAVVPQVSHASMSAATTTLDAYDHYLKGRNLVYQRRKLEAIEALQRSIELDPNYAPAHAELAVALALGGGADLEAARRALDTALDLSPGLLRAMAARGLILIQDRPPNFDLAETVLRQVLAQAPHMSDAVLWMSNLFFMQGREAEGQELLELGIRTDPLHPTLARNVAINLANRGEDGRAEAILRRTIESSENLSYHVYYGLFMFYRARGRLLDAAQIARTWTGKIDGVGYTACYCMMIWAHSTLGDWSAADQWIALSEREFGATQVSNRYRALTLRARGRYDEALNLMQRYVADHYPQPDQPPTTDVLHLGLLEALSGHHQAAVETLAPWHEHLQSSLGAVSSGIFGTDAYQALAWAYAETGQAGRSTAILTELEEKFEALERQGTLFFRMADVPYQYALNAVMQANHEQALDRLEAIIESGWRTYYEQHLDPRWDPLRDHPRFQALMAKVKAEVDRQRAELEATESRRAFVARLEASTSRAGGSME